MGRKFSFYTDPEEMKFMTRAEVVAGVQAVYKVASRHTVFMIVLNTETEILVIPRSEETGEFRFQPTEIKEGAYKGMFYLQEYNSCETRHPLDDEGAQDMLDALQSAVNDKLRIDR